VNEVRQAKKHTVNPSVPEPSYFEAVTALQKLKRYKSAGINQILAEMIKAGGNTLYSEIYKFINYILNKEELSQQWNASIIVPVHKKW
jgi:hypothetical protein